MNGVLWNLHFWLFLLVSLWRPPKRSPLVLFCFVWSFWRNEWCALFCVRGLRLAGPNEDGFPSIRRFNPTQLIFHREWFLLESCIDSNILKTLKTKKSRPNSSRRWNSTSRRLVSTESHLDRLWKRVLPGYLFGVFVFMRVYFILPRMRIMHVGLARPIPYYDLRTASNYYI